MSVTLASSLIYALLVKHEDEASSFSVSVPTYTAVGAQAAVEQLATNAIVQRQLNEARAEVGVVPDSTRPPPNAAPFLAVKVAEATNQCWSATCNSLGWA